MTAWGFMPTTSPSSARIQWSRLCRSVHRAGSSFGFAERTCDSGMTWTWATGVSSLWAERVSDYVHGVPRQPGLQSERISLTFCRLRPPVVRGDRAVQPDIPRDNHHAAQTAKIWLRRNGSAMAGTSVRIS